MRRMLVALLLTLAAATPSARPAPAADQFTPGQRMEIVQILRDALKRDPSILRDAVTAMQDDDEHMRMGAARAAIVASRGALADPADPVAGNHHGDVTVVEFFDVRCPYCRKIEPTMAELLRQDSGIRLIYKDLPILGPASLLGSKALLAAQRQGGYETLREALLHGGPEVSKETIKAAAVRLGLDWPRLDRDMDDPAIQRRLEANLQLSRTLGIQGTPAFVVGDDLIPGAVDLPEFQQAISKARRGKS